MLRTVMLSLVLLVASRSVSAGDRVLLEDFDEALTLNWQIESEDESAYSLSARPGELVITTSTAWIYNAQNGSGELPRNSFFLKEAIENGQDFEATLAVTEFLPKTHWQQVDLFFYQGLDCYLKLAAERTKVDPKNMVALIHETKGQPTTSFKTEVEFDGPLWLRMKRSGDSYTVFYSNDGDQFDELGSLDWTPDSATDPLRIGFMAYNGPNGGASAIEVGIESFELTLFGK